MLEALGAFIYRHPRRILIVAGAALAAALVVVVIGGRLTGGTIEGLEATRVEQHVERIAGFATDTTVVAVYSFADTPLDRAAVVRAIERSLEPLRGDPRVRAIASPETAPPPVRAAMVNLERGAAYALVMLSGNFKEALAAYPGVRRAITVDDGMTVTLTGRVPFQDDLDRMLRRDLVRAELVALPVALLVLLLVFRTVVAAVLPVVVGALAVLCGIAVVLALSRIVDVASYTINVVSLIGLGVAIDYSLFMVSRYREELADGRDGRDALLRMMATTGRVVTFSGLAVATGLFGLLVFRGSYLMSMGIGGAIVVGFAMLFALTLLPALLVVLGPRIHAGRLRLRRLAPLRGVLLARLAWILDHPWRVLVATTAVLLVMAGPFCGLRLAGVDTNVLEPSAEARRGEAMLDTAFPQLARDRIAVAVEFPSAPALTPERVGALDALARRIGEIDGVVRVDDLHESVVGERVVILHARTRMAPESEGARRIVDAIRAERAVGDGTLVVGGPTALDVDSAAFVVARTPYAVGFVVGVMLVVLYRTFRSVVLPIKAVVMNFLSIAASFGVVVWVFQHGHLGLAPPRPLDPSVPILLFCIVFGLSMDYHVLMLSRIREAYVRDGDNTRAVTVGLTRSAGLITSAAAIMVTVFGAFALARFVVIRSVGFGLALAIALDATLVRVLLVPASMKVLGRWNWWAPRWLRRREGG